MTQQTHDSQNNKQQGNVPSQDVQALPHSEVGAAFAFNNLDHATPQEILQLQRTVGNRNVRQLIERKSKPLTNFPKISTTSNTSPLQRGIKYAETDTRTTLIEAYGDQESEISYWDAHGKYDVTYTKGDKLAFTLTGESQGKLGEEITALVSGKSSDLGTLQGTDATADTIVKQINTLDSDEAAEAKKSMRIFLYMNSMTDVITGIVESGDNAFLKQMQMRGLASKLSTEMYGLEMIDTDEIKNLLTGAVTSTVFCGRGLGAVKEQWAKLEKDSDKKDYIEKRIAHEPSKGYNRRYTNAMNPLEQFVSPEVILVQWWYSPIKGAAPFPGIPWNDKSRMEFFAEGYAKPEKVKRDVVINSLLAEVAGAVYNKFAASDLGDSVEAFNTFFTPVIPTLKELLSGAEFEASDIEKITTGVAPYLTNLALLDAGD